MAQERHKIIGFYDIAYVSMQKILYFHRIFLHACRIFLHFHRIFLHASFDYTRVFSTVLWSVGNYAS